MRLYPDAPRPWLDLSTGINPVAFPVGTIADSVWHRLPEASEVEALETAARRAYDVPPSAGVVASPGTQALLQWLPRLFPAASVGILNFTYQEHETCWRASGATVCTVDSLAELAGFDACVVVSPNNPDGRIASPRELAALAGAMAGKGGRLIVDEAFMDLEARDNSLVPNLPPQGAIVLRSFGKTYGLAGLRLGFAAGCRDDCERLRIAQGPWAVSGPAIEIGCRALTDTAWLTAAAARLRREASRLDDILHQAGFRIVGGTALFRLVRHDAARAVFDRLCHAGILTRPFAARPDLLRFGIPHKKNEWSRLLSALADAGPRSS